MSLLCVCFFFSRNLACHCVCFVHALCLYPCSLTFDALLPGGAHVYLSYSMQLSSSLKGVQDLTMASLDNSGTFCLFSLVPTVVWYWEGQMYTAIPPHMWRGCFQNWTCDLHVTVEQRYCPPSTHIWNIICRKNVLTNMSYMKYHMYTKNYIINQWLVTLQHTKISVSLKLNWREHSDSILI